MKKRTPLVVIAIVILVSVIIIGADFVLLNQSPGVKSLTFSSIAEHSSPFVTEYPTQSSETAPAGIAVDSNGMVWFMLQNRSALTEFNPQNGTIHEYDLPNSQGQLSLTWAIILQDSKHLVWFDEGQFSNAIWSFNTLTHKFTKYPLSSINSFPFGMTQDGQGNIWFAEIGVNKIGEVTTSGTLKEYSLSPIKGITNTGPAGIVVSSTGVVWFTEAYAASIGSFYNGQFQQYNLTGRLLAPAGIALDASGNLWVTEHGPNLIAEFNPSTHYFRSISTSVPTGQFASYPYFIYVASDGNIWVNEHYGNSIATFSPNNDSLVEYQIPTRVASTQNISGATTMTLANGVTPWFTELYSGKVGNVDIRQPIPVSLAIKNYTAETPVDISVPDGKTVSLGLSVTNQVGGETEMRVAVGNLTETINTLNFSFASPSGFGSFGDTLSITNQGAKPGIYFITISAVEADLTVSRIIEMNTI